MASVVIFRTGLKATYLIENNLLQLITLTRIKIIFHVGFRKALY